MTRSQAREQAFIFVFESLFNPDISIEEMKHLAQECETIQFNDFAEKLIILTCDKKTETEEVIASYLKNWTLQRIPKVCLAILRIAVSEILFDDTIPESVSVNEAVELAKKYADEKDVSFINGVLGSVVRGKATK